MIEGLQVKDLADQFVTIEWEKYEGAEAYCVYWADKNTKTMKYRKVAETKSCEYTLHKATHVPHYFKVAAVVNGNEQGCSEVLATPVKKVFQEHLEQLSRGLVAVKAKNGIFLSWRMFLYEVEGYSNTGMTGADYAVFRNGEEIARVADSTNYLDREGCEADRYAVAPVICGERLEACEPVKVWEHDYLDIPIQAPKGGVTPAGQEYVYHANDMSVGDVDGDGEYEYIVKWDPTNSQDVSIKGYTGNCYLDCYKLDGTLLWRLDMGVNIRAGAHYTQFMVYDFNLDGKAEMAVKTAPGTKMTRYHSDGTVAEEYYITMPESDIEAGYSHADNYVCSAADYREHMVEVFMGWHEHPEVVRGQWPKTLEECFGIEKKYSYPLGRTDAEELADYFIHTFAPAKSPKNELDKFEGFIFKGPEYLTMFAGDGRELQTIPFKIGRGDDGLMWGDYAMKRIEPCNRVDRFLSGVAYLDGERPYLLICRGYYTRATVTAYDFFNNEFHEYFCVDSGFVPMKNPFDDNPHLVVGSDPKFGRLAGQGDHSLSTADVDGDGCMEIIYGAAVIDHDGSLLYSSYGKLPNGKMAKFGHGDAMHVAHIDPDRPGLQIFNVFEEGKNAPYGFAYRDAETGEAYFGEYAEEDLGRCMIGDIDPKTRGLQMWVKDVFDCEGNKLDLPLLGTNQCIHWAGDMSTQILDGVDYISDFKAGKNKGIINDLTHGIMLTPEGCTTNNGTKGNPCLVADIFGDFREELLLRTTDDKAIRIYTNTEVTSHKLFTLMHDAQYRCGVAWQNNCYNQPGYTKFYYASDMEWKYVLPRLAEEK